MLLHKNLKNHVMKSGASSIRLWGKIRGTNGDYFIAEGALEATGEEGEDGGSGEGENEARGTGINKNVYWATNKPLGEWT
jgi:hypothetical protein